MPKKATDLTGQRFGSWTVIKRGKNVKGRVYWICECDCGTVRSVFGDSLKSGKSTSCGCRGTKSPAPHVSNSNSEAKDEKGTDMPNRNDESPSKRLNDAGLRECPFCGCDKAQIAETDDRHRPNVVCPVCGVRVYGDTEYLAVLRWNMRLGDR